MSADASAADGGSRGFGALPKSLVKNPGFDCGTPSSSASPSQPPQWSVAPKPLTANAPPASSFFHAHESLASAGAHARRSGSASDDGTIIALK